MGSAAMDTAVSSESELQRLYKYWHVELRVVGKHRDHGSLVDATGLSFLLEVLVGPVDDDLMRVGRRLLEVKTLCPPSPVVLRAFPCGRAREGYEPRAPLRRRGG
jgi:hypothetical protein